MFEALEKDYLEVILNFVTLEKNNIHIVHHIYLYLQFICD